MQKERMPLYIQIQDHFKRLIAGGKLAADEKIPSEKELMDEFNVSRITVANALTQLAKDGWIYRIPGRGSFVDQSITSVLAQAAPAGAPPEREAAPLVRDVPEPAYTAVEAASASYANKKMIGLIIPTLDDFFALRLIQGVNAVLKDSDYYLTIVLTNHSKQLEKEVISQLIAKGAEGLIIFPIDAETYNEEILSLKVSHYPFVLIDRYLPGIETNFVCSDNNKGAQLAVSHLWELGHRDIAICSDSPLQTITVEERIAGYMEALKQKGAMINPALILTDFNVDYEEIDQNHVLHRYIKNRLATAYITLNGKLGLYIAGIARKLKMQMPGDISILTFDNPFPGIDGEDSFTYVAQSENEIGSRSARILIDLLSHPEKRNSFSKVTLEPKLVAGRSTGAPSKAVLK